MNFNESFSANDLASATENVKNQLTTHGYKQPIHSGNFEIYHHDTKPSIAIDHNSKTAMVMGKHSSSIHSLHSNIDNLVGDATESEQHGKEISDIKTETNPDKIHQTAINSDHNIRTSNELIHGLRRTQASHPTAEGAESLNRFTKIRDHHKSVLDLITDNKHANGDSLDIAAKHGFMITHRRKANPESIHKQVVNNLSHDEYSLHAEAALTNSSTPKKTLDVIGQHPSFKNKVKLHPNF